ncbi:DmX-like protein 2, partial [Frankliniella fusca]
MDSRIDTGTLDWGEPVSPAMKPAASAAESSLDFDWSKPVTTAPKDELVLDWGDDKDEEDEDEEASKPIEMKPSAAPPPASEPSQKDEDSTRGGTLDIMAQQLKFVACLKILMEELSTLATGFEVDGGQLRYQLYVWLEREVEALRQLCNYSSGDGEPLAPNEYETGDPYDMRDYTSTPTMMRPGEKPTLHEILMAEKLDFEAKVQRAAKRKRWLKANETLLRTLLSYCSLHGASGGGLASVRMELVLLLQELQQEKTQQQLLSPLPFPTTLPLLSASVACNKTVVADPVRHLQAQAHDMLQTIIDFRSPPMLTRSKFSHVFVLRDLSVALSACIYQSLCDSDTFSVKHHTDTFQSTGMETLARLNVVYPNSHLIAGNARRRRYSTDEPLQVTTIPSKWPGVTNLRALLARDKDEDTPRLNILLCEAFVATYMSLITYATATCDSHILYRLAGQNFSNHTWATLFGGGVKKLLRVAQSSASHSVGSTNTSLEREQSVSSEGSVWTSITKQRARLNMKLLGQFGSQAGTPQMKEDKPTYREQFVSPEMSMLSYFLNKPQLTEDADDVDYDSADSAVSDLSETEDEDDDNIFDGSSAAQKEKQKIKERENVEHSNPNSYSWCVLRLAVMKIVQCQLQEFLNIAGIELQELPVCSPLIHGVLRAVNQWIDCLRDELDTRGPAPVDYIPGCYVESTATGPAIHKYRSLLDKSNTPFNSRHISAAPARRLWSFLVRQEAVQEIFIRCVFGKKRSMSTLLDGGHHISDGSPALRGGGNSSDDNKGATTVDSAGNPLPEPVRIIHKEQDSISAFCLNQVNAGLLALATPREVQEMDISLLLELPSWLEDECEFDIINLNKEPETLPASSFLVIQTAADRPHLAQTSPAIQNYQQPASPQPGIAGQSGRGASVVMKHKVDGIRRLSAHPLLPLYLTGSQDGSVQMWEWGHAQPVSVPRSPGTFAKVTRVRFSEHGNKFGVADGDGNLSLWQIGLQANASRPFFTYQCHSKVTSDFVFLGACSLVATAGHSSESKNVALWDTLLPQKKSLLA